MIDEDRAHEWLTEYNRAASEVYSRNLFLWWDYKTNMTDYNLAKAVSYFFFYIFLHYATELFI